jgi:hemerythrin superfamily protein
MNVLKLLKKDHSTVRGLLTKFENTGRRSFERRHDIFDQVRRELLLHAKVEEQIFYPALKAVNGRGRKLVSQALNDHRDMEQLLRQVAKLEPEDQAFVDRMEALMEVVDNHVEEEEREIFRFAEENCPESQLEQMGREMENRKRTLEQQWAA